MVHYFCDVCDKEISPKNANTISVRVGRGGVSLHSSDIIVCDKCLDATVPTETSGVDDDIVQMLKETMRNNLHNNKEDIII